MSSQSRIQQVRALAGNVIPVRDSASAGSFSELAVTANQLVFGDGAGFTAAALTGDITNVLGVTEISAGVIVNADINAAAAIAYSKLNLAGSIVNADINAAAAIVYSKLNLTGGIVNADIASGAAIALSKLAEAVIQADGGQAFTADQSMGGFKLTNVAAPTLGGDAANKTYVDNLVTLSIRWKAPVAAGPDGYIGNFTIAGINGLTPVMGMVVVATSAGTPTAGTSDPLVIGSVAEFDGTSWQEIVAGSGGFVPSGTRLIVSVSNVLSSPLTDTVDENKIVSFDGTSLTPNLALAETADGTTVMVSGETATNENTAWTFDGTVVTTGVWIKISSGVTVSFSTINTSVGGPLVADSANDTLTLTGSGGILVTGTAGSDTATFTIDPAGSVTFTAGTYNHVAAGAGGLLAATANAGNQAANFQNVLQVGHVIIRALTTSAITTFASAPASIGGVTLSPGDPVGLFGEGSSNNGVWAYPGSGNPFTTRYFLVPAGVNASGYTLVVREGTAQERVYVINNDPATVGSTTLTVTLVGGFTAGTGITIGALGVISAAPIFTQVSTVGVSSAGANGFSTAITLTFTTVGHINVYINGQAQHVDKTTGDCFFSSDGGTTELTQGNQTAGATLYFQAANAGWDIVSGVDKFELKYGKF